MVEPAAMLEVRGLTKSFGPRRALDDIHLDVRPGEIVALVGENGAGKSTLVKCIAGMLTPDRGTTTVAGDGRLAVVWQDLALCDNLDAVANIFLGMERGRIRLDDAGMRLETRRLLGELGLRVGDLSIPVGLLSGGQRQMIAVARSLMTGAKVLLFDEPTAALGVNETRVLEQLLRRLRATGIAVLMVSHRIEQVFALADRIAIMRHGSIVSVVSPLEVHPDDVVAIMAGAKTESTARRQLSQLRSLVDQLAEVEPAASLPLILTSLSRSLSTPMLGLWLVDDDTTRYDEARDELRDDPRFTRTGGALVLTADVAMDDDKRRRLRRLPIGAAGGVIGASALGTVMVATDADSDPTIAGLTASAWAVPVIGSQGVLAVIAGFGDRSGHPGEAQLELVELHANLATVAIERESMLGELTRRNHLLESLRGLLDRLAGPEPASSGLSTALVPLRIATGADTIALFEVADDHLRERAATSAHPRVPGSSAEFGDAQRLATLPIASTHRTQMLGDGVAGISIVSGDGRALLLARWDDPARMNAESLDLLEDASRSLALALERQVAEHATQETQTLRRANAMQRDFLHRLSHELRTPLTAIRGFADSLLHTDVDWDDAAHDLFLERISTESSRMGRLVADLLDSSAIETGQLRLQMDWCDLSLVIDEAVAVVSGADGQVHADVEPGFPPVWADHDRIEQILVNVIENALRHGQAPVRLHARVGAGGDDVVIAITDSGPGFTDTIGDRAFEPHHRSSGSPGAGLGLTIARGLAVAHHGSLERAPDEAPSCIVLRLPIEPLASDGTDDHLKLDRA